MLINLIESQFGIGMLCSMFLWNLFGIYVQVILYIYFVDVEGNEYNFFVDYYCIIQELVLNIFCKGYQWLFYVIWVMDFGFSLLDMVVV